MKSILLTEKQISDKIYLVRGEKVMLDSDLAELYNVSPKVLNQSVKRNANRFPADFTFQLTSEEFESLRSQFATSNWGGRRYLPFVFTEQGVAMLSSVVNSEVAISVNIQIIRVFTKMRTLLQSNTEILKKLNQLENHLMKHDERLEQHEEEIKIVFNALKNLVEGTADKPALKPSARKKIGFLRKGQEPEMILPARKKKIKRT